VTIRSHHGTPQFVQPCPGAQVAAQAQNALQPRALAPCFCAVTHQKARNHKTSGFRVSWKIVPAVSDTWYPQPAQTSRLRLVIQLEVPRQRGQTKPSGPTQLKQVFSTRSFSPKSGLQFGQRSGVPLQRPLPQHIGLLDSTKYPESGIWTLVRPAKAGMFSGRQSHRGRSQEPRNLDRIRGGNEADEADRPSHPWDGE